MYGISMHKCLAQQLRLLTQNKQWSRCYTAASEQQPTKSMPKTVGLTQPPDAQTVNCDYIGPPDAQANLRPYVRHFDAQETEMAKRLRLKRIEVEQWNMDFWTKHNKRFYEEKADFIRLHNLAGTATDEISADSMSVFYKTFLDKNKRLHMMYNISWYLKNFDILTMAFQLHVQKLFRRAKGQKAKTTVET